MSHNYHACQPWYTSGSFTPNGGICIGVGSHSVRLSIFHASVIPSDSPQAHPTPAQDPGLAPSTILSALRVNSARDCVIFLYTFKDLVTRSECDPAPLHLPQIQPVPNQCCQKLLDKRERLTIVVPVLHVRMVMAEHHDTKRPDPSTDWNEVQQAIPLATPQSRDALGRLMERYKPWLLARLASRFHFHKDEVQDVLQSFIEHKILKGRLLGRADPRKGSFRAFLRNAIDNFAISELRRRNAHKRSPGADLLNIDSVSASELPIAPDPASSSPRDVVWAQAVIAGALLDMRNELARLNRLDIWEVFEGRVLHTILNDEPPLDYSSIVARYNYESPAQAINILVTAKRMFRRHLRSVIAYSTLNETGIEEEVAQLKWVLERQAPADAPPHPNLD
jgi:DNA-directed RNA polymerase specialized sigma24 family protein